MASTAFYEHPNRQQSKRAHRHSDIDEAVGVMKLMASLSLSLRLLRGPLLLGSPLSFFNLTLSLSPFLPDIPTSFENKTNFSLIKIYIVYVYTVGVGCKEGGPK
jgi:hypothetical protein